MTGYIGIGGTAKKVKNIYVGVGGVAKKVKKGYIGVGGVAKLWYSSGYTWEKYTTTSGYGEVISPVTTTVTTRNNFYVASTYSLDSTTGDYTVTQDMLIRQTNLDDAIGNYIYSWNEGTYTDDTIFYIENIDRPNVTTYRLTVREMTSEIVYSKGTYVGTVSSDNPTAYPMNGVLGDYWYVLVHNFGYTFSYTGNYSETIAEMGGSYYHLLTLTGSGTLTLSKAVTADVWLCGGGANGSVSSSTYPGRGGGGGYARTATNRSFSSLTVTVGAAGGDSSTSGGVSLSASGTTSVDGGTGGGGAENSSGNFKPGTGDGNSKVPFSANDYFVYPYCDGGGGGGQKLFFGSSYNGGAGGTNGSDGGEKVNGTGAAGAGGGQYGGAGGSGNSTSVKGVSATGYGSGGGGNGVYAPSSSQTYANTTAAGSGYQGVCFIRIPFAA